MPGAGCNDPVERHSHSGNALEESSPDMRFLLPLALLGLGHIADGTNYDDAVQYLVPPVLVKMLMTYGLEEWKSMEFESLLENILDLKHMVELRCMIPVPHAENVQQEALLRYLRRVRHDQFKKCIREHRKLREMDDELGDLNRRLGITGGNDMLGEDDEDRATFIDDECVQSDVELSEDRHSQKTRQ